MEEEEKLSNMKIEDACGRGWKHLTAYMRLRLHNEEKIKRENKKSSLIR